MKLLLRGGRLVDPQVGLDQIGDVLVVDGRIEAVGTDLDVPSKATVVECAEKVVMPGLVDLHTHLREPGREDEETVASGTRAAAHGGFTAVCAMPNTEPVCDTGSTVRFLAERAAAAGKVRVHVVGAMTRGQKGQALAEIGDMVSEGAVALSDDGHDIADSGVMRRVMDYSKAFNVPVIAHCEDEALVGRGVVNEGVVSTRMGLPGWPAAGEEVMVARTIRLVELTGCRAHLAHLSSAGSVELLRAAKEKGLPVTGEVTPHHLFLTEDDVLSYDTNLKMNPPLRTAKDVAALRGALKDGVVDCIATDHAPHAHHEKELEFELAPFGTTGLETALPLVITHLVDPGEFTWSDVARVMSVAPRACLNLPAVKLEQGSVADITVIDPEAKVEVTKEWFVSKSANSAFLGKKLLGKASDVLVGGEHVLRNGKVIDQ